MHHEVACCYFEASVVMSHHKTFEHVEKMRNIVNKSIEIVDNE